VLTCYKHVSGILPFTHLNFDFKRTHHFHLEKVTNLVTYPKLVLTNLIGAQKPSLRIDLANARFAYNDTSSPQNSSSNAIINSRRLVRGIKIRYGRKPVSKLRPLPTLCRLQFRFGQRYGIVISLDATSQGRQH
jgi:hypothetical protein